MVNQEIDKEFTCIWSLEDPTINIPGNAIKVKRARLKIYTIEQ